MKEKEKEKRMMEGTREGRWGHGGRIKVGISQGKCVYVCDTPEQECTVREKLEGFSHGHRLYEVLESGTRIWVSGSISRGEEKNGIVPNGNHNGHTDQRSPRDLFLGQLLLGGAGDFGSLA